MVATYKSYKKKHAKTLFTSEMPFNLVIVHT